jgi:hypothetical protein
VPQPTCQETGQRHGPLAAHDADSASAHSGQYSEAPQQDLEDSPKPRTRLVVRALLARETPQDPVTGPQVQAATELSRSRAYAVLRELRAETPRRNGHPAAVTTEAGGTGVRSPAWRCHR